jgi:phosphinothricin acetyltransferase
MTDVLRPGDKPGRFFIAANFIGATLMPDLSIRQVQACDVAAITHIYGHSVLHGTASFEIEPPLEAEMAQRRDAVLAGGYPYFVAQRNGEVAGYAYCGPYRVRPGYWWTVEDSIYIAPEAQKQGIGRILLARLIEEAEARGFRQMIAVIGDSSQAPSIRLHESLGFRPVGMLHTVGFKFGRWIDSVLMQRALGEGAITPP